MKINLRLTVFITLISSLLQPLSAQLPASVSILNKSIPTLKYQTIILPVADPILIYKPRILSFRTKNKFSTALHHAPLVGIISKPPAFFCKIEVLLEKKNGMPIKLRLGDVDKVDQLEGKFLW
jgi:hypothetical protein